MSYQEEQFVHFVSSTDILNKARRILREIKRHKDHPLVSPAFQFAIVEYSKPYMVSYSAELNEKGKPKHKFSLDDKFIPANFLELHERLLKARNQIHAHDDLSVKEAKLYVTKGAQGKVVGAIQNKTICTEELNRIDEIIELVEKTLDNMYVEVKRLEAALPINSEG